jgi:uncharacterized membrane protein
MYEFFHKYFVEPILISSGYNIVNTLAYALILIFAIFFVYKILNKLKIKIDGKFVLALLPWVLLGSILRVLEDYKHISYFLISPLIYITIFSITFSFLLFSLFLEKKTKITYHSYLFSFGFILAGIFFTQIRITNFIGIYQILSLDLFALVLILIFSNIARTTKPLFNKFTIFSQIYDSNSTFVSLQFYNFREQHVLPNFIISILGGNWIFFVFIKFIVVLLFVYLVDSYIKNKNFRNWLKLVVIILGTAQGTRDMLALGVFG